MSASELTCPPAEEVSPSSSSARPAEKPKALEVLQTALQPLFAALVDTKEGAKSGDGRKTQVHVKFTVAANGATESVSLIDEFKGQVDFEAGKLAGFRVSPVDPYKAAGGAGAGASSGAEGAEEGGETAPAPPRKRSRRSAFGPASGVLSGPRAEDQPDAGILRVALKRAAEIALILGLAECAEKVQGALEEVRDEDD